MMDAEEPAATAEQGERRRGGDARNVPLWLTAGAPVAIALVSLVLSLYTIVEANREPEIWLTAPDVVRVAAGDRAWFYVQPRFVSAARNDRVAVIADLRLEVAGPDGGPPVAFTWDEQGTWQYDPASQALTWIYLADPAPLVVAPSSPQLPICLFTGPAGWRRQEGTYWVTIAAGRGPGAAPLRTNFVMTLPTASADLVNAQRGTWVEARTGQP
jgi:hypothetical protein